MIRFDGKVALITGGASGIGRATALALAAEGGLVLIGDRDLRRAEEVARETQGAIEALALDVTDDDQFAAAIDAAVTRHGRLDILFNNAGAGSTPLGIAEMEMAQWDAAMALLLRSVALGIKLATPVMIRSGGGAIVNTASVAALSAGRGPIAYSVAKAGVVHLTKVAAAELARHNIRVNAVCPGLILTDIFTAAYAETAPALAAGVKDYMARTAPFAQPLKRPGLPSTIADAVMFLASDAASLITGTHLVADGGMTVGPWHSWDPEFRGHADHPLTKAAAATG